MKSVTLFQFVSWKTLDFLIYTGRKKKIIINIVLDSYEMYFHKACKNHKTKKHSDTIFYLKNEHGE